MYLNKLSNNSFTAKWIAEGGPFHTAGVKIDDVIVRIQGSPAMDLTHKQIASTLRALTGTVIQLFVA